MSKLLLNLSYTFFSKLKSVEMKKSLLILFTFCYGAVHSQWSNDPNENMPVCIDSTSTFNESHRIITDGNKGAIIAWQRSVYNNTADSVTWLIEAQRFDNDGYKKWGTAGIDAFVLETIGYDPYALTDMVPDYKGGAYILINRIVYDFGNPVSLYLQHIDSNGNDLWQKNGILITSTCASFQPPSITSDKNGNCFVAWSTSNKHGDVYDYTIRVQKIDESGLLLWDTSGIEISAFEATEISLVSDDLGGLIIAWYYDYGGGGVGDIFAQHVNDSGQILWDEGGVNLISGYDQKITTDSNHGAIIACNGLEALVCQHIDKDGKIKWGENGVRCFLKEGFSRALIQKMISDDKGGVICLSQLDKFQRISYDGKRLWGDTGVYIPSLYYATSALPDICKNGSSGVIITYFGDSVHYNGLMGIYAQNIDSAGVSQWPLVNFAGIPVSTSQIKQQYIQSTYDNNGGAIICWQNSENNIGSYYAQHVPYEGVLPLQFISFSGNAAMNKNNLYWQIAQGLGNSGFYVERSSDGNNFSAIGFIKEASTSYYSFIDYSPLKGNNYYRIKQTNKDNKFSFSKIISVNQSSVNKIMIYPNPAQTQITVDGIRGSMSICDGYGRIIKTVLLSDAGSTTIDISAFAPGVYYCKGNNAEGIFSKTEK